MPGTGEAATLRPKQPKVKVTAEALQGGKLAQIGTVIETRFSASERKVYKNFAHNLVLFIKGTEAESARDPDAMQRLQKIRNIVFITQLLGVIDVLTVGTSKICTFALQRVECSALGARGRDCCIT